MKEKFTIDYKPQAKTVQKINWVNAIIDEYQAQGYTLTLRQLFYQFVSRNYIENSRKEYDSLSEALTNARMAGLVDWEGIEDRGRVPRIPSCTNSIQYALLQTAQDFRVNRQSWQDNYIEVSSEKDALSGILERLTNYYHINLIINKGYNSTTGAYGVAQRIKKQLANGKKFCYILYLGDHDPSGLDMVRDVNDRLNLMNVTEGFEVKHIALTTAQVELYKPPENKLKKDNYGKWKDPRGPAYFKKFGNKSWEVDALSPALITELLQTEIESIIDIETFRKVCEIENKWKQELFEMAENNAEAVSA
jgi:hypothetical protein